MANFSTKQPKSRDNSDIKAEWLTDPNVRRCSPGARITFVEILCLMTRCEERGILASCGVAWTDDDILCAIPGRQSELLSCLAELLAKGVLHRTQAGAVFFRPMVCDEKVRSKNRERQQRFRKHTKKALHNAENNADVTPMSHAPPPHTPPTTTATAGFFSGENSTPKKESVVVAVEGGPGGERRDVTRKSHAEPFCDQAFLDRLQQSAAYSKYDIPVVFDKFVIYHDADPSRITKRDFMNWLNNERVALRDNPADAQTSKSRVSFDSMEQLIQSLSDESTGNKTAKSGATD